LNGKGRKGKKGYLEKFSVSGGGKNQETPLGTGWEKKLYQATSRTTVIP